MLRMTSRFPFFFFNDTATTEIYTLSLHDALPIFRVDVEAPLVGGRRSAIDNFLNRNGCELYDRPRSEEHTSELQSQSNLVCRLLLEKKKNQHTHLRWHVDLQDRYEPASRLSARLK